MNLPEDLLGLKVADKLLSLLDKWFPRKRPRARKPRKGTASISPKTCKPPLIG